MNSSRFLLLCSIDGLRPDALQAADTPTLDQLIATGAVCWHARSVTPSVTLPAHVSLFYGVDVPRHGVDTNEFKPLVPPIPSLLDVAKQAGCTTGAFYNWEQIRDLAHPGTLDVSFFQHYASGGSDEVITAAAIHYLQTMRLEVVFVYLGDLDIAGHGHGWMSDHYLSALQTADRCIGRLVHAEVELGRGDSTVVMVVTDHGGHDTTHGTDCDEDMVVPWLVSGPGVRQGLEIQGPVHIFDTPPTAAWLLGWELASAWEGNIVAEALDIPEY